MSHTPFIPKTQTRLSGTAMRYTGWQRRLLCTILLVLLIMSNVHGVVNATAPEDTQPRSETRAAVKVIEAENKGKEEDASTTDKPLLDVIDPYTPIYCPAGSGLYCYTSTNGSFTVEEAFHTNYNDNTAQPDSSGRALLPGGHCLHSDTDPKYTEVMRNAANQFAWVIYDLGEVFEISKFISRDLHHGNWWIQYSEDGSFFNNFDFGQTNWSPARCTSYLYDRSSAPVRARYIKYMVQQVSNVGNAYRIAWFSFSSKTYSKAHPPVLNPSIASGEDPEDCPICGTPDEIGDAGDPVNTRTGGFDYRETDLSVPTIAGPLAFQRSYASSTLGANTYVPRVDTTLGYGWTSNQDVYLLFPATDEVWFKSHTANRYLFTKNTNGTYTPYPGVTASLSFVSATEQYILVDSQQSTYTFDINGKLLRLENSTGHAFNYTYTAGMLSRVSDPGGARYLDFTYTNGLLTGVSDHTGRSISYTYDASDNLATYTDALGNLWTYTYDSGHRIRSITLTDVGNPTQPVTQVRNLYDTEGRVVCQQEGDEYSPLTQFTINQLLVISGQVVNKEVICRQADGSVAIATSFSYNDDGTVNVKDAIGHVTTHSYNVNRNILAGETDPLGGATTRTQDANFRPTNIVNPAGHELEMTWSADGANLLEVVDPEENTTTKEYNDTNNPNKLTKVIDPLLNETSYTYNAGLMTSMINALEQTTTYTYTSEGELNSLGQPQPGGLLKTVTDPTLRATSYEYDSLGQKISVTDPLNRTTHYTYDSLGRVVDTTDPQGRVTHNEYNAAGRLLRTTRNYDPARPQNDQNLYNIVTEYEYDAEGHQILVRDTLGHETEYHYDQNGRLETTINALDQTASTNIYDETGALVETIDAAGNHTTYVKDAAGRSVSTLDPFGQGSVNTYDIPQNATTVTDALDHATVTYFDRNNRPVRVVNELQGETLTTYDGNGNVITKTDSLGHVTFYEYDELNRVERQVQNYDPARPQNDQNLYNIVTTYAYDTAGNQTQVTDTLGRVIYRESDMYGRLFRQTRNHDPSRPQNDQGQYNVVTEYGYDENGIQNRVTDTFGHVTLSEFDLLGRLSSQTQNYDANRPQNDQNQYNLITEYRYNALGNQTQVIDPQGRITFKEYDALNRLVRQTQNYDPNRPQNDENQYNIVTVFDYDELGRQYRVTDTYGQVTFNEYNTAGQLIHVTRNYDPARPQNDANLYNIVTSYEYDEVDHQVQEIDTYGKVTFYEYDELGRKASKTVNYDPNRPQNDGNEYNLVTRYAYDLSGRQTDETDPNGVVTHFEYDALGRLAASLQNYQPGVTPTAEINVRIEYTYDVLGNRLTRTDPRSNSTGYNYDALGRLSGQTTPLLHNTTFEYDALDRMVRKTDGNGALIQYGYDALSRQTTIDYPAGEADVTYTYNLQDQPLTMTDGLGTTTWTYDRLGRVTSVTNADGSKVEYTYDALGNRLTVTTHIDANDVTGRTITNAYDALNRLTSVTDWQGQPTTYGYDALGRLTETHLPNGVVSTYTYNTAGRLVDLVQRRGVDTHATYHYTYDPAGNRLHASETILWVQDGVVPPPAQFTAVEQGYMAISLAWPDSTIVEEGYTLERSTDGEQHWQLVAELGANTLRYTDYGLARHTRYWYRLTAHNSQGGSQVQTAPAETGWDAITDGTTQTTQPRSLVIDYTYDPLHRLKAATYDDGTAFGYTYDEAGNTLQAVKTIDSQTKTTVYTYDADNQLETAQENGGTVWQYNFNCNGSLVESLPSGQPGVEARRYTYNAAGQLTQVEAHNGTAYQVQAEMVYNGLGQRLSLTAHYEGQSLSTQYIVDGSSSLAATADGQSTFYLPGIGELNQGWSYYLSDGTNSARQLTSPAGAVTLTRSFTPWGDLLEMTGTGDFTWGYLGGLLDAATGLIYVGNGQYYDSATGRFLSRGVYPGAPNPYVPWQANPLGMIVVPLVLLRLVKGKRKAGKIDQILVVLVVLMGVSLSCVSTGPVTPTPTPIPSGTPSPTGTEPMPDQGSRTPTPGSTPPPPTTATPAPLPCPTPSITETPFPTPEKLPLTVLDETKLDPLPAPKTGVSALQVYQLYKDMWVKDENKGGWWWGAFGSDREFSIWDFISATSYYEASRQTRFASTMAEAGVRFYYGRASAGQIADTNPESVVNWWAAFSESTAKIINSGVIEPANLGTPSDMSIVGEKFEKPGDWRKGWDYSSPYNWGNLYALGNEEIAVYKANSQALFIKYGTDAEWDSNQTFVVPSGCLWAKAENSWTNEVCPAVKRVK